MVAAVGLPKAAAWTARALASTAARADGWRSGASTPTQSSAGSSQPNRDVAAPLPLGEAAALGAAWSCGEAALGGGSGNRAAGGLSSVCVAGSRPWPWSRVPTQ